MSNGSGKLRRAACGLLVVLTLSCSWFRHDTEDFYYDYAIKIMERGIDTRVRDKCHFTTDVEGAIFSQVAQTDLDLFYKQMHLPYKIGGFYSEHQKKIVYSKWRPEVIAHETVHHVLSQNPMSKTCLEEMLAEMVQYAMEQDNEIMHMHNQLGKRK